MNTTSESAASAHTSRTSGLTGLSTRSPLIMVSIVAILILCCGGFLMSFFINADYTRDERNWQDKLTLVAETRASHISLWVRTEQTHIQNLANNPSLKLYVTEWINERENAADTPQAAEPHTAPVHEEPSESDPAQATFIRNLLVYSAESLGYATPAVLTNMNMPQANAESGLMLIGNDGVPLIAIPSSISDHTISDSLKRYQTGGISDIYTNESGTILLGFSHPVDHIQSSGNSAPLAQLIGVKNVTAQLEEYLRISEGIDPAIEVALARTDSGNLQYFTYDDAAAGPRIQIRNSANDPRQSLEAESFSKSGEWLQGNNRNGAAVLMTSQAVPHTPWAVIVSVPAEHALAASNMRRQTLWTIMIAFSVVMALLIVAIWLIATSQRALSNSRHYRQLAKHSSMQEALLKMIANSQPETLFLIDSNFRFRYANYHAAKLAGANVDNLVGKTLSDVLGQAKAQALSALATEAMNTSRTQTLMLSVQKNGAEQTILRTLVPVTNLGSAADTQKNDPHVLVIDRDITEVTEARERRMKLNNELIELLVALMDQRDQHANNHSRHVAELAQAIASNMGLAERVRQHVYHAGLLMNVGKMVVPEKWLNSSEPLDDKNIKSIRQSLKASSQLLSRLDFDPAVITALKQAYEHVDGSGMDGLKGADISIEARIITVANACISMLSQRAYREAMSWEDAAKALTSDINTKYDRGVVAALISYMENMGGKERIKSLSGHKKVA